MLVIWNLSHSHLQPCGEEVYQGLSTQLRQMPSRILWRATPSLDGGVSTPGNSNTGFAACVCVCVCVLCILLVQFRIVDGVEPNIGEEDAWPRRA